jgi:hypothetical protein
LWQQQAAAMKRFLLQGLQLARSGAARQTAAASR